MHTTQQAATTNINNLNSSLSDFYQLTSKLSKLRFVRFTGKEDEADNIQWSFTYHKRKFVLQYSIYNGISLFSEEAKEEKLINKLAGKLHLLPS